MQPQQLSIKDFTYELPDDRIAKYPLAERDLSRLLVYKNDEIFTGIYRNLDEFLPENTLLIFNDTKVVEARLWFQKSTGGIIEIFCLEPHSQYADITTAMLQKEKVLWKCLIGGAGKWKHGAKLVKETGINGLRLTASIVDRLSDCFVIQLEWQPPELTFAEVLHQAGLMPLPPYLHRDAEEADKETYQTIYAHNEGSVAAPTAGLHFTNHVFEKLEKKNIQKEFVTLHVGAGTFKPVKAETLEGHEMHAEFIDVSRPVIKKIAGSLNKEIVAVGTTSLRTIESLYWMGLKTFLNPGIAADDLQISQWEVYALEKQSIGPQQALSALLSWMEKNSMQRLINKTQLLITPGYSLRIVRALITNFHQPQSTLLLLIASIAGDEWKRIYNYALQNGFRFLSYGDGCLLWPKRS